MPQRKMRCTQTAALRLSTRELYSRTPCTIRLCSRLRHIFANWLLFLQATTYSVNIRPLSLVLQRSFTNVQEHIHGDNASNLLTQTVVIQPQRGWLSKLFNVILYISLFQMHFFHNSTHAIDTPLPQFYV